MWKYSKAIYTYIGEGGVIPYIFDSINASKSHILFEILKLIYTRIKNKITFRTIILCLKWYIVFKIYCNSLILE